MVNRLWHYHFGADRSDTERFWAQWAATDHPQLLDWLASQFVGGGRSSSCTL
jgi:hypothetical protein